MSDFKDFGKIKRLFRDVVITEKLDGTNAQIYIQSTAHNPPEDFGGVAAIEIDEQRHTIWAGSRNRYIQIGNDNYGWANFVKSNAEDLAKLGPGRHFGEWWGKGIQRNYSLTEKRFSLFNTHKWNDSEIRPKCCHVVPILYEGEFHTEKIKSVLRELQKTGSVAAPGFMDVEGIVVFHTASNHIYKYTVDDNHKG